MRGVSASAPLSPEESAAEAIYLQFTKLYYMGGIWMILINFIYLENRERKLTLYRLMCNISQGILITKRAYPNFNVQNFYLEFIM